LEARAVAQIGIEASIASALAYARRWPQQLRQRVGRVMQSSRSHKHCTEPTVPGQRGLETPAAIALSAGDRLMLGKK
jgi:hypothetical protein